MLIFIAFNESLELIVLVFSILSSYGTVTSRVCTHAARCTPRAARPRRALQEGRSSTQPATLAALCWLNLNYIIRNTYIMLLDTIKCFTKSSS